jgi:hypothetical protein
MVSKPYREKQYNASNSLWSIKWSDLIIQVYPTMIDGRIVYEHAQDDSYGGSPQVNMDQSMILIMTSNLKWLILLIYLLLSIEMMYHQEGCNVSLLKKSKCS